MKQQEKNNTKTISVHIHEIEGWVEYKNSPEHGTSGFSNKLTLCIGYYDIGEFGDDKGKPVPHFINVERYISTRHSHKMEDVRDGDKVKITFKIKGRKWMKDGEWQLDRNRNKAAFPSFYLEDIEILDVSERKEDNMFSDEAMDDLLGDKKEISINKSLDEPDDLPF